MITESVPKSVAYQVSKVNDYYPGDLGPDACSIYATVMSAFSHVQYDESKNVCICLTDKVGEDK
jgi:hypothetical protein